MRQTYLCCSLARCKICFCKKSFEAHYQTIIDFIYLTKNKDSKEDYDDSDNLEEPHGSNDDVTVDGDYHFSKNNQNNHLFRND